MKNILTFLTLLTATSIFATDRFVDPNLSSGNGTTLFTTITSAVNAAVDGDRIIIASTTYNEPALTISKSLQIMPQTPGATINFNANIIVSGFGGMKLEMTGFSLGVYSFSSNPVINGWHENRAKVSFIQCSTTNVDFNNNNYDLNLIKSSIINEVNFRYGNIVSNSMTNCYLWDEGGTNQNINNKILIVSNIISNETQLLNDDFIYVLANNMLKNLRVQKWVMNSQKNSIINNEFSSGCQLHFAILSQNPDYNANTWDSVYFIDKYNFIFSNNKFDGSVYFSNPNTTNTLQVGWDPYRYGINYYASNGGNPAYLPFYSTTTSKWPNNNSNGFFEWSYNGVDLPSPLPSGSQPLSLTKIIGSASDVDGGNPNHDYYDIDLTINDRGINGGPYTQLNYNPTANPNSSKAFIFDLDMPTDLFPGQSIDIKAKGYHKN